jgi:butyrate kinase
MRRDGKERILVINPGSTSTKVAVFVGEDLLVDGNLPGPAPGAGGIWEEFTPRLDSVQAWLEENEISPATLAAVVGRGGLLRPLEGGTYRVNEAMLSDARANLQGVHASNLGCALARAVADAGTLERQGGDGKPEAVDGPGPLPEEPARDIPAFAVDPVSTDEFQALARYSGLMGVERKSLVHALSLHALVREVCRREGRPVEGSSFVAAHLGGGISVCPIRDGRILDGNNANSGGPFSPNRAGGLPVQELLDLAYSGDHSESDLRALTMEKGGLMSYLGIDDAREVEARIDRGDREASLVFEAMAYQIAKEIGAMATVLRGEVEGILLTGGLAASPRLTDWIRERVSFIAPVSVLPAVEEMRALALGGLRVLRGEEAGKDY